MNIVYQIGDLLEASVEKRQETNDKAIDFVMALLTEYRNSVIDECIGVVPKRNPEQDCEPIGCTCGWCRYSVEPFNDCRSQTINNLNNLKV